MPASRGSYLKPISQKLDAHDGDPWSEMDIRDLTLAIKAGDTIEEVESFLCRSGTVDDVRRMAQELRSFGRRS